MPRNCGSLLLAGVAGGTVSISRATRQADGTAHFETRTLAVNAGCTDWLSSDPPVAIFQVGNRLFTCTEHGEPELIGNDLEGANELAADAGRYMARYAGALRINWGGGQIEPRGNRYVGDVAADGSVVELGPSFDAAGQIVSPEGLQALGNGQWSALSAAWRPIASSGTAPVATPTAQVYGLRRLDPFACYLIPDGRFVVALAAAGAHGEVLGKALATVPGAFRPDLSPTDDGYLLVTYATTEGEAPGDLRGFFVHPSELTTDLRAAAPPIEHPPVDPPPVDPPKPPDPPVEPPQGKTMQIPQKIRENTVALIQKHSTLARGSDDDRRALMKIVAEQNCFSLGKRWGTKSASQQRPPSKDAIAYNAPDGTLYGADCINGATREAQVPNELEEMPGQWFIEVAPVDHLGGGGAEPGEPTDPVDDEFKALVLASLKKIDQRIAVLEHAGQPSAADEFARTKLGEHDKVFEALGSQLSAIGPADKLARRGDPVSVKVPILGTARGSIG